MFIPVVHSICHVPSVYTFPITITTYNMKSILSYCTDLDIKTHIVFILSLLDAQLDLLFYGMTLLLVMNKRYVVVRYGYVLVLIDLVD